MSSESLRPEPGGESSLPTPSSLIVSSPSSLSAGQCSDSQIKGGSSMSELTKKKALEICRDLWTWLAEHPYKQKSEWPGWNKYGEMRNSCPCCEYAFQNIGGACTSKCLIRWPGGSCTEPESPFAEWCRNNRGSKYALKIVKLANESLKRLKK
jgi:hypothetical protein